MSHRTVQKLSDKDVHVVDVDRMMNAIIREYPRRAERFTEMLLMDQFTMQTLRQIMTQQEEATQVDRT